MTQLDRIDKYSSTRVYHLSPIQRQENIQKALNLLEQSGCKLVNIGATDILTKNTKLILGLVWQLVQHFHVFQVSVLIF